MASMLPSPDRADERSVTPMGFARAVFSANELGTPALDESDRNLFAGCE